MAAQSNQPDALADLVHQMLVVEQKASMQEVARKLGMRYPTFYARVRGRVPFSAADINAILRIVPDVRLADALLVGTGVMAVPRPDIAAPSPDGGAINDCAGVLREITEALAEIDDKSLDEMGDPAAIAQIEQHVDEAERCLVTLKQRLVRHRRSVAS